MSKNKIKIVIVINSLYPGGAEQLVIDDIEAMIKANVDVTLITLKPEKKEATFAGSCVIPREKWFALDFKSFFSFGEWLKMFMILVRLRPTVAITHLWFANTVGRLVAFAARVPVIMSFEQNVYNHIKSKRHFFIDKLLQYVSDRIIAISESVKESLVEQGIHPAKITVLMSAINLDKYRHISAYDRKSFGIENGFLLIFIGRLVKQKGVDLLIRALSTLDGNFKLIIAGDGPDRALLENMSNKHSLAGRVKFLGFRRDVAELIKMSDCFILPSRWEGLGIVLLEAMAVGKPIIASNVDGIKEIIKDERSGLKISPNDIPSMASAIKKISTDNNLREKMVQYNKERVIMFGIERHAEELIKLAKSILNKKNES